MMEDNNVVQNFDQVPCSADITDNYGYVVNRTYFKNSVFTRYASYTQGDEIHNMIAASYREILAEKFQGESSDFYANIATDFMDNITEIGVITEGAFIVGVFAHSNATLPNSVNTDMKSTLIYFQDADTPVEIQMQAAEDVRNIALKYIGQQSISVRGANCLFYVARCTLLSISGMNTHLFDPNSRFVLECSVPGNPKYKLNDGSLASNGIKPKYTAGSLGKVKPELDDETY